MPYKNPAHKRERERARWQARREAAGLPYTQRSILDGVTREVFRRAGFADRRQHGQEAHGLRWALSMHRDRWVPDADDVSEASEFSAMA